MVKKIGDITLYSVIDLQKALKVNARTIRQWFTSGRITGQKLNKEWHVTEKNLERFLSGDEGIVKKAKKTAKNSKRKGVKKK